LMAEQAVDLEKQAASGIQSQYKICPIWSDKHSAPITSFISFYYVIFSFFNLCIGILIGIGLVGALNISVRAIGIIAFCLLETICHSIACCAVDAYDCHHMCKDNRSYRGFLRIITFSAMIYTFVILSMHYLEKINLAHIEVGINIIYFCVCAHTFTLNYFIYVVYIPSGKYILTPVCRVIGYGIRSCCPYTIRCLRFVNKVCN